MYNAITFITQQGAKKGTFGTPETRQICKILFTAFRTCFRANTKK